MFCHLDEMVRWGGVVDQWSEVSSPPSADPPCDLVTEDQDTRVSRGLGTDGLRGVGHFREMSLYLHRLFSSDVPATRACLSVGVRASDNEKQDLQIAVEREREREY